MQTHPKFQWLVTDMSVTKHSLKSRETWSWWTAMWGRLWTCWRSWRSETSSGTRWTMSLVLSGSSSVTVSVLTVERKVMLGRCSIMSSSYYCWMSPDWWENGVTWSHAGSIWRMPDPNILEVKPNTIPQTVCVTSTPATCLWVGVADCVGVGPVSHPGTLAVGGRRTQRAADRS